MTMFKNKHIVAAVIIAPVLALIGYFATDHAVNEKPHAAEAGASYSLVARPNCRYTSGQCALYNGDLKIDVQLVDSQTLSVTSSAPLNAAEISIQYVESGVEKKMQLTAKESDPQYWETTLSQLPQSSDVLRIVVSAQESLFFAETALGFLEYETVYGKDFKRE